jgi:formamidopyrimidine-DNA glycosylase
MPELPEVETIVRDLSRKVLGRTFLNVWTDFPKLIKKPNKFEEFKKGIKGKKIKNIKRRAKNIIFELSDGYSLLVHQKMTGHLLVGKWNLEKRIWKSEIPGPLREDPMNKFLHLIFWLNNGQQLALSDLRKFAKVELWKTNELENSEGIKNLGPEPLGKDFTFKKFKEALGKKKKGKIKQVLMDQSVISGIGNIYSDEILFEARIHPFQDVSKLSDEKLKNIYKAIKKILPLAIKLGGESISDYRRPSGEKGFYDKARKIYRKEGEECPICNGIIKRVKIGGRSAHFCPKCQKLS